MNYLKAIETKEELEIKSDDETVVDQSPSASNDNVVMNRLERILRQHGSGGGPTEASINEALEASENEVEEDVEVLDADGAGASNTEDYEFVLCRKPPHFLSRLKDRVMNRDTNDDMVDQLDDQDGKQTLSHLY